MSHVLLIFVTAALAATGQAEAKLPTSLDLTVIRGVPVQHGGRWQPVDTLARDIVNSVTGDTHFQGQDPVKMLLAWTFDSPAWMRQPLIKIRNAELRGLLDLPSGQEVFSYAELAGHRPLHLLVDALAEIGPDRKPDPLEAKVSDINQKLIILQDAFGGATIRFIPDPDDPGGAWRPITAPRRGAPALDEDVLGAWLAMRGSFLADDAAAFTTASADLSKALAVLPAAHRPNPKVITTELRYNRLRPFQSGWMVMAAGALLAALALLIRKKWFDGLVMLVLIAGLAVVTYGLFLRWQIAGRIPASNMYESLLFLGWGVGLFAIVAVLVFRDRMVPLTASAMAALSLFLADVLPMDAFVRPIAPVLLDTVWMTIHVPIIMVSYSVLALGVLVAHVQIVAMAAAPRSIRISKTIDSMHYWYIHVGSILLLAGILTGSMWAASSWGRYWGWDPKEVWSLVALLGYLTILHVRISTERPPGWFYAVGAALTVVTFVFVGRHLAPLTPPKILAFAGVLAAMALFVFARGRFATAAKSILCFWLIIMTYVGVNFVLGTGLHSYGFGKGAVALWMFGLGGLDLLLVAIFTGIYLARRGPTLPAMAVTPTT